MIKVVLAERKKDKKNIDLKKYMGRGSKMFQEDAQEYIRKLRSDDRV